MDTTTITAEIYTEYAPGHDAWVEQTLTDLPGWTEGDPAMAVALLLFGYREAVSFVRNAKVQ